jgi:hypothetical protein
VVDVHKVVRIGKSFNHSENFKRNEIINADLVEPQFFRVKDISMYAGDYNRILRHERQKHGMCPVV